MKGVRECSEHIHKALAAAMCERPSFRGLEWIDNERFAVASAANQWALAHDGRTVTVGDIERLEGPAVGHFDYARKLCLYVAEHVTAASGEPTKEQQ